MRRAVVLLVAVACHDPVQRPQGCELCDAYNPYPPECGLCDPRLQTGCYADEKCTWVIDEVTPHYVGHIGCVLAGSAAIGSACSWAPRASHDCGVATADDCVRGAVCDSAGGGPGTCHAVCDNLGGSPMCDQAHGCVADPLLFSTGATSPVAAGLCMPACDPLADNDFDGSGSALSRSGSACGSAAFVGCYGIPSGGTPPATVFTCMPERNDTLSLRHRSECTVATGCADSAGNIYVNSCNQGYEPLFRESTAVSTAICVAFCTPADCYAGNCGTNNANRLGAPPHRCTTPDAVGAFGSDEECEYLWREEIDGSGNWLPSAYSNSVGICSDHAAYGYPSCATLPLHGSGSGYDAVSLGCVSSQTAGLTP